MAKAEVWATQQAVCLAFWPMLLDAQVLFCKIGLIPLWARGYITDRGRYRHEGFPGSLRHSSMVRRGSFGLQYRQDLHPLPPLCASGGSLSRR